MKRVRQADLLNYLLANLCPIQDPTLAWFIRDRYRRVMTSGDVLIYMVSFAVLLARGIIIDILSRYSDATTTQSTQTSSHYH